MGERRYDSKLVRIYYGHPDLAEIVASRFQSISILLIFYWHFLVFVTELLLQF